jgi:hypothetical protein
MPADLPMQEAEGGAAVHRLQGGTMTFADLQAECWAALPPIRKRLVGRETVNDLVQAAVENWGSDYLNACQDNDQRGVYVHALLGQVKRAHQVVSGKDANEYGFIWVFLLQAVAVAAIEWLVKWWLDRRANRVLMTVWQHELTK